MTGPSRFLNERRLLPRKIYTSRHIHYSSARRISTIPRSRTHAPSPLLLSLLRAHRLALQPSTTGRSEIPGEKADEAPLVVAASRPRLMSAAPNGPPEGVLRQQRATPDQPAQEPPDLRHRQRQEIGAQAGPLFSSPAACRRVTARNACAKRQSVMWRCQPSQRRTSY